MATFDFSEAVFTLLDIHLESIRSVKAVVSNLNLEQSVSGIIATDALSYRIQSEQPPDLIVIEAMQACLDTEPQALPDAAARQSVERGRVQSGRENGEGRWGRTVRT